MVRLSYTLKSNAPRVYGDQSNNLERLCTGRVRSLILETDSVSEAFYLNHMKQVSAQQVYVEFSLREIITTPLLTPNICSLSVGNISTSDQFPLFVSSRSGFGLGKCSFLACKCTCSCRCCALNVVVTADVSIQAH
jgi:hypothetical protein